MRLITSYTYTHRTELHTYHQRLGLGFRLSLSLRFGLCLRLGLRLTSFCESIQARDRATAQTVNETERISFEISYLQDIPLLPTG